MKATILHDDQGKIISISKYVDLKKSKSKFVQASIEPGTGHRVVEVDLNDELERIPIVELHEGYRVEVSSSKLIKKHSDSKT